MKIAISIPDALFQQGEAFAEKHEMTRSDLYRRALDQYLQSQSRGALTDQLNRFFDDNPDCNGLEPGWAEAQADALGRDRW